MNFKRFFANMTADKKGLQKKTSKMKNSYDEVNRMVQALGVKKRK